MMFYNCYFKRLNFSWWYEIKKSNLIVSVSFSFDIFVHARAHCVTKRLTVVNIFVSKIEERNFLIFSVEIRTLTGWTDSQLYRVNYKLETKSLF